MILNAILLGIIGSGYVLEQTGQFDYAVVNGGIERMCSDQFRQTVEASSKERGDSVNDRGVQLALLDYPCAKNGAKEYYQNGFKDYAKSLGLTVNQ